MKRTFLICLVAFFVLSSQAYAYWIWTPETRKWLNPKYSVKETPKAQLEFARGFLEKGQYKKANNEFQKLINYYPKAAEAAEAQYYMGESLEKLGEPYQAFKSYQKVIEKYPFSERITEIIEREFKIGEMLLEQKTSVWQHLSGYEYPVVEVFRAVIENAPYSKFAPASYYNIGLFLEELGGYPEAKVEFDKIVTEYPQSDWVDKAKYQIALCEYRASLKPDYDQTNSKSATEKFEEILKSNPDTELSKKAKATVSELKNKDAESNFIIAKYYEKRKLIDSAKIYYRYIIENYPDNKWAAKAQERLYIMEKK